MSIFRISTCHFSKIVIPSVVNKTIHGIFLLMEKFFPEDLGSCTLVWKNRTTQADRLGCKWGLL
jgi:hypothetical protein